MASIKWDARLGFRRGGHFFLRQAPRGLDVGVEPEHGSLYETMEAEVLMSNWTAGYVTDVDYTFGYYPELNPLRVPLAFIDSGLVFPKIETACELGFGQGISVNFHGAATPVSWWANDFNPSQAGFAQEMAAAAGGNVRLFDQSFEEFLDNKELPDFDFIGIHGIWSWISNENRAFIVEFLRRKLKVGGIVYVSYNTYPGWNSMMPIQHLLSRHNQVMGAPGAGIINRLNDAIAFAEKIIAVEPTFARVNPTVVERLTHLKKQSPNYIAHEYLNRNWDPMHFADFATWLEPAKLDYGCSAHYFDHVAALNLTAPQQELLASVPDPMFRETVRDLLTNQQFRRDYWVKGARRLSIPEQIAEARKARVVLSKPMADISLTVKAGLGEATLAADVYQPILDLLANGKAVTLGQIETALQGQNIPFAKLLQAVIVLIGSGSLSPAQEEDTVRKCKKSAERLNNLILNKSQGSGDISYLVSPVTASAVALPRLTQLFVVALQQGNKTAQEIAAFAWRVLVSQGQAIIKEGQTLVSEEDNLAEANSQAEEFLVKHLPFLRSLGIL